MCFTTKLGDVLKLSLIFGSNFGDVLIVIVFVFKFGYVLRLIGARTQNLETSSGSCELAEGHAHRDCVRGQIH